MELTKFYMKKKMERKYSAPCDIALSVSVNDVECDAVFSCRVHTATVYRIYTVFTVFSIIQYTVYTQQSF